MYFAQKEIAQEENDFKNTYEDRLDKDFKIQEYL